MVNIHHRVGIKAPIATVYEAIATTEGIANWWTRETSGESTAGKVLDVRFVAPDGEVLGSMGMEVIALEADRRVHWRFRSGPTEWIGTDVTFELKQENEYTILLFSHRNWREEVEFMAHCSMKWATFLLSLRSLLETGTGYPSPEDMKIDNWN